MHSRQGDATMNKKVDAAMPPCGGGLARHARSRDTDARASRKLRLSESRARRDRGACHKTIFNVEHGQREVFSPDHAALEPRARNLACVDFQAPGADLPCYGEG
jgi:hypothetical protein